MKTLTLEDLFIPPQSVDIPMGNKSMTVWVRPLSNVERELAQAVARNQSRRYRKILEDKTSEQYQLLVKDEVEGYSDSQLADLWVQTRLVDRAIDINRRSLEDRDSTFIPEPEGNSVRVSDLEKHENQVDEIESQRESGVIAAVGSAREQLQKEVAEVSAKVLRTDAEPAVIDNLCSNVWQREYSANMIARGTFKDEGFKTPLFKTVDQVKRLRPHVLEILTNAHYALLLEPEALKTSGGE